MNDQEQVEWNYYKQKLDENIFGGRTILEIKIKTTMAERREFKYKIFL